MFPGPHLSRDLDPGLEWGPAIQTPNDPATQRPRTHFEKHCTLPFMTMMVDNTWL